MGPDPAKAFLKKNSELIPAGENVQAVVIAEPKGGAWRRGMRAAPGVAGAVVGALASIGEGGQQSDEGETAAWPEAPAFWLVLTDKQMHVFGGKMGSSTVDPGGAHYPWDRVANINLDKKLMISKLDISFKDGSAIELGLAKQKLKPFAETLEARFGGA